MNQTNFKPTHALIRILVLFFILFQGELSEAPPAFAAKLTDSVPLTDTEKSWLEAHQVIRLAPDPSFQPIEFFDKNGDYAGVGADYVRLIEEKLGIRFEIVRCASWDDVISRMKRREVDVLNAVIKTPQREQYMQFPPPYLTIPSIIIVRKNVGRHLTLEMLEGMHIVMVSGYGYVDLIHNRFPKLDIELVSDLKAALRKVSFGMADAFVGDLATASFYIESEGITNLRLAGETNPPNISGFAVRSDWPELSGILEKGISLITKEEREAIFTKWIHLESEPGVTMRELWELILIIAGAVALIITGFLLWNRSLKRMVYYRTESLQKEIEDRKRAEEERQKLQNQLLQAQKMESIGRLAGGVAHDINNMLYIIMGYAEMALEKLQPSDPLHGDVREIISAAGRSADVVRQLLTFARKQTISPKVIELNDHIAAMLKMLRRLIGEDIDLIWNPAGEPCPVKIDPSQVDQLLINLAINAQDAIGGVGKVTVETANKTFDAEHCRLHTEFRPGDYVMLTIGDNGSGMDEETLANIFEPFYTTKGIGQGTGLGLAMVYGIVKQNKGIINIHSELGQGSIFEIYLPRYESADTQGDEKNISIADTTGEETVLLVEDERSILKLSKTMLEKMGYHVLAVHSPEKAIRLAGKYAGEIHLLITDVIMPKMNGRDLSENLLALYPNLKVLYMSGYTTDVIAHHGVLDDDAYFIQKPFNKSEFFTKIREILDQG